MTDSQLPTASQRTAGGRTVTITRELQTAIVRDMMRYTFSRWIWIAIAIVMPTLAVFCGIIAAQHGDLRAIVYAVGLIVTPIGMFLAMARIVKRGVVLAYPVGEQATARIDDTAMSVTASATTFETPFDSISRVRDAPSTLLLDQGRSGVRAVPRAILGEDDIARLRAAVASARL